MSALTGAAIAAHDGSAAVACEEGAGARAAIVIVGLDPIVREILHRELSRRYGAAYHIVACDRSAELAPWIRGLRKAGLPVAMVIGVVGGQEPDVIEVLA